MSRVIRSTTVVDRLHAQRPGRPIYVIASDGEVFVARRTSSAFTWVPANEADFGVRPAARDAFADGPGKS